MTQKRFLLVIGVLGFYVKVSPVYSQIIPDRTTNTSIINDCQNTCQINGGNLAGDNLFHSFDEFNLQTGESAYFADPGVANIFSRVTGDNASEILGTLGINGDANLWLLNPNGIIFGEGATLDVNGSFLATTADEIQFGDNGSFAVIPDPQENLALLTVNPDALFFNQINQNGAIEVNNALLSLPATKTLTLLGKQTIENIPGINLVGSRIIIPQGNINLGAIADRSRVSLEDGFNLSFTKDIVRGDIALSRGSAIDVGGFGAGNISIVAKDLSLTEKSIIAAATLGNLDGGKIYISSDNLTLRETSRILSISVNRGKSSDIEILAEESVDLIGMGIDTFQEFIATSLSESSSSIEINSTSITSTVLANGLPGKIEIKTPNLNLYRGSLIIATTTGLQPGGNISLSVEEDIVVDSSGIFTAVGIDSQGNAGTIDLKSNNLWLQTGSVISSSSVGIGNGGDINLDVTELIHLRQSHPNGIFPTSIFTSTINGDGEAGDLNINTNKLILEDGGNLSSASGAISGLIDFNLVSLRGKAGKISIDATDSVEIKGISSDNRFPSGIINSTSTNNPAGGIAIATGTLKLSGQAIISTSSFGVGDGGNIDIDATESIAVEGIGFENLQNLFRGITNEFESQDLTGGLFANTQDGRGGNIFLNSPNLILDRGAFISSSTFGNGNSGNISIAGENIEVRGSIISTSTINFGDAGKIEIQTDRLTTSNSGLITTSSIGLGNAGDLKINATESIELLDTQPDSLNVGGLATAAIGFSYPGNIEVNTKNLTIRDGAKIDASNKISLLFVENLSPQLSSFVESLDLNISQDISINAETIEIFGQSSGRNSVSQISSTTGSQFPAGNIYINTSNLSISDRAEIEVRSLGDGKAGNLNIFADRIELQNRANLNASTVSGKGGNINLNSQFIIASEQSNISADAMSGRGGNINIIATDLFITPDSKITASSELGIDGKVNLKTFNTSDRNNLVKLPQTTAQTDNQVISSCGSGNERKGVFTYTGRGGLPQNPMASYSLGDLIVVPDFNFSPEYTTNRESTTSNSQWYNFTQTIVEAFAWKINRQGKVELVAKNSSENFHLSTQCPFKTNKV